MGVQKLIVASDDQEVVIQFDITGKLADLRKTLIDLNHISDDDEKQPWRFVKVEDGKATEPTDKMFEIYIPVNDYIYDTNKIRITNLKKDLQVFADSAKEKVKFDVTNTLAELRKVLIERKFIIDDTEGTGWRFLSPTFDPEKGTVNDAIITMDGSEKTTKVKDFLYGSSKVRMVDIKRKIQPDLIGVSSDYFNDGDIDVIVSRNDGISKDKFQPIMMTHVRPAREDGVVTDFSNVVLCEKGTSIGIRVETRRHKGMMFSIKPEEGDDIVSWVICPYRGLTISAYDNHDAIIIVSAKDVGIPTREKLGHRRLTVLVWKLTSFIQDGKKVYFDEEVKPMSMSLRSGGKGATMSVLRGGGGVDPIDGKDIEDATFERGEKIEYHPGGVYDVVEDPKVIYGKIDIDFFVFKSREAAQNMVEMRINPIYS
ncbi:uncharacterized protein LOC119084343 [Bradysia coprophila]|uniref:uncharacterized protein LOC119084343 n=1 Tax=Bradysia coprophila TaxID=38358 RepID=UPI00187D826A|nr:uncharacterized protein LOC119084343 [Bradysia coprophila]